MRTLAVLVLLVVPLVAAAQGKEGEGPVLELRVKPLLCILDGRAPQCEISFLVTWRSDRPGDYCLFNDLEMTPLRCWPEQLAGELIEDRTIDREFSYWMAENGEATQLAVVKIEVLRADDEDRRRRRRSRHVWDLL